MVWSISDQSLPDPGQLSSTSLVTTLGSSNIFMILSCDLLQINLTVADSNNSKHSDSLWFLGFSRFPCLDPPWSTLYDQSQMMILTLNIQIKSKMTHWLEWFISLLSSSSPRASTVTMTLVKISTNLSMLILMKNSDPGQETDSQTHNQISVEWGEDPGELVNDTWLAWRSTRWTM